MNNTLIYLANDHGGFDMKQQIIKHLEKLQIPFSDEGCSGSEIVRYPYFASKVCEAVAAGKAMRGILICSTGIGMSIFANKYKGIRASLCTSTYMAKMTRAHNDSNVLCLGGKITGIFEAIDILDTWLNTPYEGGRHDISLGYIKEAEETMIIGKPWVPEAEMR